MPMTLFPFPQKAHLLVDKGRPLEFHVPACSDADAIQARREGRQDMHAAEKRLSTEALGLVSDAHVQNTICERHVASKKPLLDLLGNLPKGFTPSCASQEKGVLSRRRHLVDGVRSGSARPPLANWAAAA